jgi:hypothetical protein
MDHESSVEGRRPRLRMAHLMAAVAAIALGLSAWPAIERFLIPPNDTSLILHFTPLDSLGRGRTRTLWSLKSARSAIIFVRLGS